MKKYFRVEINVVSTTWETCDCLIEAESAQHARKLFDADLDMDWDNWEYSDSEVRSWDVESIEYDEWYTKRMKEIDDAEAERKKELEETKDEKV